MATVYPQDSCVHSLFEAQAARTPDTTALIFEDAQLTYQELNQRANQVAGRLRALGIGPEALVGICVERSFELVIGVLGILKAGGAYVLLDPAAPPSRLASILQDAQVAVLLTHERLVEALPAHALHTLCLESAIRAKADENAHNPTSGVAPGNLAYVIYTSGSTGRPKGVLVEHRNLVALLHTCQQRFGFTSDDVMPWIAPAIFDIALFELFNPLLAGGATRILERRHVLDLPNLIWTLEQSTVFHAVPSLMRQIVQMVRSRGYNRAALDHIRMIFVGGDLVAPTLLRELQETFEQAEIVVLYGPTESTVICTHYIVPRNPHPDQCVIGAPLHHMYIYLCDSQQQSVSSRTPGEIYVGGTGVTRGYLNRPDLTAERFVPNPFAEVSGIGYRVSGAEPSDTRYPAPDTRLYKTGDLARYRPGDTLEFLGRIDEQVKVRGYRIEPAEIEITLAQHPRVQEAAVIAQDDPSGEKRLIAYLVPQEERVQLWPSIGEYFVYDELIYYGLTHDERRNARYKAVLQQLVCDKVVVDIGTGSDAILARLCAEAGARKVYAIEILADSYRRARRLTTELGLEKTITLIHGDATEVSLPEPADICVSEIVEAIGGAEGAAVILSHARRLLKSDGICIPERSVTKIAAARLPDELIADPRFSPLARHYVEQIFAQVGYPFDVRLCIKHFPASNLLSDVQVFEDLDFTTHAEAEFRRRITLRITKTGRMDGFLLWLNLHLGQGEIIDILDEETAWFPAYFPIFEPGVDVAQGDRIEAVCSATLSENGVNPDYAIQGMLIKGSGERISFEYESAHHRRRYRATPFYRRLFRDEPHPSKPHNDSEALILELRDFLAARLPEYMLPAIFAPLDAMPHTPNGKIDRGVLSAAELSHLSWRDEQAARTPVEELLAGIWSQLLGLAQIGRDENFFVLGGHSLLATQLISRIRQTFQVELRLPRIFDAPTVAAMAEQIERARMLKQGLDRPAIVPVSRDQPLRLSFPQEMVWILAQLAPENIAYHFQMTIRLKGRLDIVVLQRALSEIVARHEILRTTFAEVEGYPAQIIHPPWRVTFPMIDLRTLPQSQRERQAEQLVTQELGRSFSISRLPLIRWILLRLACDEHLLIQIEHHFVHDGWSISVLLRELKALYTAFLAGERSPLEALPIQYADFAAWQRRWMEGEASQAQLGYWRQKLADRPPLLEIPSDYPRPNIHSFRGGAHRVDLPADLYPSLKALSRRNEATLFMTLLAAYKLLLYRYTAQEDLLIGSTVANRQAQEAEGLIGMIVNTIILRTNLSGNPTFVELLRRIRTVTLEAYAHQELPFEKLVEALQPDRDLSHNPLFQTGFSFHDAPVPDLEFGGLRGTILERHNNSAKFDLSVVVVPYAEQRAAQPSRTGDQRITMLWEYSADLFEATTIKRMIGHYVTVLRGIISDSARRLADAPLLTAAERYQLLVEWNGTALGVRSQESGVKIPHPVSDLLTSDFWILASASRCIQQLFEAQVARTPGAVALIFQDRHLTYAELNRRANQLAHYLHARGVGPETLVGLCMERSPELIIGLMGILKAGGAYVPLDPAYPPDRLALMLEDSQAQLILTNDEERRTNGQIDHLVTLSPCHLVRLDADWPTISRQPTTTPLCPASADNLAYALYTSGSTGRPKGVMIAHRGLVNIITTSIERFGMRPAERVLQLASLNFDASALEIYMALLAGASLCLVEPGALASSDGVVDLLRRQTINVIVATPSFLEMLPDTHLPDLETIIVGGESCSAHILARWAPGRRFFNAYAPTETTIYTTFHECAGGYVQEPPIGRPVANTRVYVLDRHMQPAPIGVPGEICVGGLGVARGYLNRPDLTVERFVPNPFAKVSGVGYRVSGAEVSDIRYPIPDTRLYKTGDLARYRPDGALTFLGRTDSQVKVRGFRIELGEIEAILRQHAQVRDAVVETRANAVGGKQLVAYVVPSGVTDDRGQGTDELRAFLKAKLPNYMIPATFISLDALPLTPTGKLDRGALPAPDPATRQSESPFVEPRTPIERALADIWGRLLGLDRVSATDNFFDLGGHSLLATQAISHIRAAFPVDLPLLSLFDAPTITQFAQVVEDRLLAALESLSEEEAYLLAAQVFQTH